MESLGREKPLVSVVLPAFNEAAHLERNVDRLTSHLGALDYEWELIVVDDGSSDSTRVIARKIANDSPRVRLVEHPVNLGLGQAIKSGLRAAQGRYVVTFDADLSYSPDHIDRLIATIEATRAKVVVASPYMRGGSVEGVPWLRALLSRTANRLLKTLSLSHISTTTGMVRVYEADFLRQLSLKSVDNQINAEIIYKTGLLREQIVEIPAHLVWTRNEEDTKVRRGSFSVVKVTIDFLFSGFIFRPFMFFLLPGLILLLMAFYALGWATYHVISFLPEQGGSLDNQLADAAAAAFRLSPHSFIIGGIALIFSFQLISLGIVSAQSKRYFEELWFQGTWLARRGSAAAETEEPEMELYGNG